MEQSKTVDIKVLGTGCPKCQALAESVKKVAEENQIAIDVEKVTDIEQIMSYGVMMTPGLVVNGDVKCAGKLPKADDILAWLQ